MRYTYEELEMMGDALEEFNKAVEDLFGKEYDLSPEELNCPVCGSYGACDCESPANRIAELEKELTRVERERDEARAALNAIEKILKTS
jgi:hypothetical protein